MNVVCLLIRKLTELVCRVWIRLAASNHYGVAGGPSRTTTFTGRLISSTKDINVAGESIVMWGLRISQWFTSEYL